MSADRPHNFKYYHGDTQWADGPLSDGYIWKHNYVLITVTVFFNFWIYYSLQFQFQFNSPFSFGTGVDENNEFFHFTKIEGSNKGPKFKGV